MSNTVRQTSNSPTLEIDILQAVRKSRYSAPVTESIAFNRFCRSLPYGSKHFLSGKDITSELQASRQIFGKEVLTQTKQLDTRCSYVVHNCKSLTVLELPNTQEVTSIKRLPLPNITDSNYQEKLQLYLFAKDALDKEGCIVTIDNPNLDASIAYTLEQTFYSTEHPFSYSDRAQIAAESGFYASRNINDKAPDLVYCISGQHGGLHSFEPEEVLSTEHKENYPSCKLATEGLKPNGIDTKVQVVNIANNNESSDAFNIRRIVTTFDCQHLYLVATNNIIEESTESKDGSAIALEAISKHVNISDITEYLFKSGNKLIADHFRPECQEYIKATAKYNLTYNLSSRVESEHKILCKEAVELLQQANDHVKDFPNIQVLSDLLSTDSIINQISKLYHLIFREFLIETFRLDISPDGEFINVDKDDIEILKAKIIEEREQLLSEKLAETYDEKIISLKTITDRTVVLETTHDTRSHPDTSSHRRKTVKVVVKGEILETSLLSAKDTAEYESNDATLEYTNGISSMLSSNLPALKKLTISIRDICDISNILNGVYRKNSNYINPSSPLYLKLKEILPKSEQNFLSNDTQSDNLDITELLLTSKPQLEGVFNYNYRIHQVIEDFYTDMSIKVSDFNISAEGNITFKIESKSRRHVKISREIKIPSYVVPAYLMEPEEPVDNPTAKLNHVYRLSEDAELDITYLQFSSSETDLLSRIRIGMAGKLIEHFLSSALSNPNDLISFDIYSGKIIRADEKIIHIEEYINQDDITLNASKLLDDITLEPTHAVDTTGTSKDKFPVGKSVLIKEFFNSRNPEDGTS